MSLLTHLNLLSAAIEKSSSSALVSLLPFPDLYFEFGLIIGISLGSAGLALAHGLNKVGGPIMSNLPH